MLLFVLLYGIGCCGCFGAMLKENLSSTRRYKRRGIHGVPILYSTTQLIVLSLIWAPILSSLAPRRKQ